MSPVPGSESFPDRAFEERLARARVAILEGMTIQGPPAVAGADFVPGKQMRAVLQGRAGAIRFDSDLLSKHVLFVGGIGTGKTNAMKQLIKGLRITARDDDVFVVFDSKGDFLDDFYDRDRRDV